MSQKKPSTDQQSLPANAAEQQPPAPGANKKRETYGMFESDGQWRLVCATYAPGGGVVSEKTIFSHPSIAMVASKFRSVLIAITIDAQRPGMAKALGLDTRDSASVT